MKNLWFCLWALSFNMLLWGQLSPNNPSVNATAETLPAQRFEIGIPSFHYGIDSDLMVSVSTLDLLDSTFLGSFAYKLPIHNFPAKIRVRGFIGYDFLSPAPIFGGEFKIGFSPAKKHVLTLGVTAATSLYVISSQTIPFFRNSSKFSNGFSLIQEATVITPTIAYDYYTDRGHLFYVGIQHLFYYGLTLHLAKQIYVGLTGNMATYLIPYLPYIYIRF